MSKQLYIIIYYQNFWIHSPYKKKKSYTNLCLIGSTSYSNISIHLVPILLTNISFLNISICLSPCLHALSYNILFILPITFFTLLFISSRLSHFHLCLLFSQYKHGKLTRRQNWTGKSTRNPPQRTTVQSMNICAEGH